MRSTCSEIARSCWGSAESSTMNSKSKRDNNESWSPIFSIGVLCWSYYQSKHINFWYSQVTIVEQTHPSVNWISSSKNRSSSIQSSVNSSFGNGDAPLFHNFMDCRSIHVAHFVEFINTYNSSISQHHSPGLQPLVHTEYIMQPLFD